MTEKYLELYKKYRPRTWGSIIGQDIIVNSLKGAVLEKKIPTAYMFLGTHGCGKTSSAFVLAKALNCEHLKENGDPCNECQTCKAIDNQSQIGIRYVSMANNGTADEVRKITSEARIAQPIKQPVMILDEVHRLSPAGFDSLLIPLENESVKTLYILCSTEPEKIPKTILSRCQIRSFKPVDAKTIAKHLQYINEKEQLGLTNKELVQVVRSSNGSVRDSIRNLETLATHGALPEQYSELVLKTVMSTKYTEVFLLSNKLQNEGQSFSETIQRLYSDLSNVLVMLAGGKPAIVYPFMEEVAKQASPQLIITYLNILGDTINSMSKNVIDSRILFDIALSKIVTTKRKFDGR